MNEKLRKMKKIGVLLMAVLCATGSMFCQGDYNPSEVFNVSISEPHRVIDAEKKIYRQNDQYIVSLKTTKKDEIFIQTFDKTSMKEITRTVVKTMHKNAEFENFQVIGNRFYYFYSLWDKKTTTEILFAGEIDPKTAKMGDHKNLIEINGYLVGTKVKVNDFKSKMVNKFKFEKSKAGRGLMIRYRTKEEDEDTENRYDLVGFHVFDDALSEIWSTTHQMKYTEAEMTIYDFALDSKNNAFILTKVYHDDSKKDKQDKKDEKLNYHMVLVQISAENQDISYNEIVLDDNKFIKSILMYEKDDDEMLICGYYKNTISNAVDGIFAFHAAKGDQNFTKSYYEIPLEILNSFASKREKRKNEKAETKGKSGEHLLQMKKIIVDQEGNLLLVGEELKVVFTSKTRRVQTSSSPANGNKYTEQKTYYRAHHYGDILVAKIDSEGELNWMTKIPKNQIGKKHRIPSIGTWYDKQPYLTEIQRDKYRGGLSYSNMVSVVDNSIYFLYVDHFDNINLTASEVPKKHLDGRGGFFTSAKLNYTTGAYTKERLFDFRNVKGMEVYQFTTDRIVHLAENEIAIEFYKKKKEDVWIRVGLK